MGKKSKVDGPNPSNVPNRDIIQRLNFLYQASTYLNVLHAQYNPQHVSQPAKQEISELETKESSSDPSEKVEPGSPHDGGGSIKNQGMCERPGKRKATTQDIARSYLKSMKVIGQKTNVKMDPSVKRTLCSGCNNVLISGVTAKVRIRPLPSHGHAVNYICMNCSTSRRLPAPPLAEQKFKPLEASRSHDTAEQAADTENVGIPMDAQSDNASLTPEAEIKNLKRRKIRQRKIVKPYPTLFSTRPDHILFVGNERAERSTDEATS